MTHHRVPLLVLFLALLLLPLWGLSACGETPNLDRRAAYLAARPNIDPDRAEAISKGDVKTGMTKEEVRATVGEPLHIKRSEREAPDGPVAVEIWIYPGPVVRPSVLRSSQDSEFLIRLEFVKGVLRRIREI